MKIKEVVEERRKLTIEERLLLQCRNNNYDVDMHFKKNGLVDVVHNISNNDFIGVFLKEIIREPTFEEKYAIWVKQMLVKCPCYDGSCESLPCNVCIFSGSTECCSSKHGRIVDWTHVILKDKEIMEE